MTRDEFYKQILQATKGNEQDDVAANYLRALFYINEGKKSLSGLSAKDVRGIEDFVGLSNINDMAMVAIIAQIISGMTIAALSNIKTLVEQKLNQQEESDNNGKTVLSD
jgi:hypothetical protein